MFMSIYRDGLQLRACLVLSRAVHQTLHYCTSRCICVQASFDLGMNIAALPACLP